MRTSLEWLGEFLPGEPIHAEVAAEALTHGGLPVEVIERFGDDTVIDVEVTSNRSDCLSHAGVAREVAALVGREFRGVKIPPAEAAGPPASDATSVCIEAPALCPHYTARVIKGVKVVPSPAWMVRRLEAVGLRSINNVADVTNYVMFETGQPLHAFDFDRLGGRRIVVREARPGEKLVSIDGHERVLEPGMLVIADAERPVALAGVMGGRASEVSGSTVNVLLESARFDPLSVRRTARALAMRSDSSYRFERGIDPTLPDLASVRAAQLIVQTAGGQLLAGVAEAGCEEWTPKTLTLRLEKLRRVLGIDVSADEAVAALRRLQLQPVLAGDGIQVTVPSWRLDLNIEVDLVEEVARVLGYARVPVREEISIRVVPPEPWLKTQGTIRETLVAAGYFEAITFSFVTDLLAGDFVPGEAGAALSRANPAVRKADASLRPSILPGLLEGVRRNENAGTAAAKLFEIGSVFWNDAAGRVVERRQLGLVGSCDVREVRGAVEAVLAKLDRQKSVSVSPDARAGFGRGACGRIEWSGQTVGYLGVIEKSVAEKLSLRDPPAAAELDLSMLLAGAQHVPQLSALPKFPPVERDLSLVVKEGARYDQIERTIRGVGAADLEDVVYKMTYRGKPLEKGVKSVTVTLVFRSEEGTLTGDRVDEEVKRIVAAAGSAVGAVLRV
jgi:phenylalanyl-tRNA synthetase beta chain